MNKEFQYTYDETNFREKMSLLSEIILHKQSSNGSYILLISLFLVSGSVVLILNLNGPGIIIGPLLLIVGMIFTFRLLRFYYQRRQFDQVFQQKIEEKVEELNSMDKSIHVGFFEDYFVSKDDTAENRREWGQMHSYLRTADHLYIIIDNDSFTAYALNTYDLPNPDFQEICTFVEQKLTAHQLSNYLPKNKSNPEVIDN